METLSTPVIPDLAQVVCLVVAFLAGLVAAGAYLHRRRTWLAPASKEAVEIIYRETPTVRLVESQRVDRLRKIARLTPGTHLDVVDTPAGLPSRFRVTLRAVTQVDDGDAAQLIVEFGGTPVSCGPAVREVNPNEFIVPRTGREETRSSVFHFQESGHGLDFMRIRVRAVDRQAEHAEIDILQVAAQWPAGSER